MAVVSIAGSLPDRLASCWRSHPARKLMLLTVTIIASLWVAVVLFRLDIPRTP